MPSSPGTKLNRIQVTDCNLLYKHIQAIIYLFQVLQMQWVGSYGVSTTGKVGLMSGVVLSLCC
jgi:hypothetical protein